MIIKSKISNSDAYYVALQALMLTGVYSGAQYSIKHKINLYITIEVLLRVFDLLNRAIENQVVLVKACTAQATRATWHEIGYAHESLHVACNKGTHTHANEPA